MNIHFWQNNRTLVAGTSLRFGGYSQPPFASNNMAFYVGDNKEDVLRNRHQLAQAIQIPLSQWVFPKITHSTTIHKVTQDDVGTGTLDEASSLMHVDAIYTDLPNVVLSVFHADCIPLLLYDPTTHLIGAIHAGWVGTLHQITPLFIKHWMMAHQVDPSNIQVYVGPALSQENFEIKHDVIEKIQTNTPQYMKYVAKHQNKTYLDAIGINIDQLIANGVQPLNITTSNKCTYSNPDAYFSYRKQKVTGRHVSFIALKQND